VGSDGVHVEVAVRVRRERVGVAVSVLRVWVMENVGDQFWVNESVYVPVLVLVIVGTRLRVGVRLEVGEWLPLGGRDTDGDGLALTGDSEQDPD